MKIWIDRTQCQSADPGPCQACLRQPMPERQCVVDYREDRSNVLTGVLHTTEGDQTLVIPPELRSMKSHDGWSEFVPFEV